MAAFKAGTYKVSITPEESVNLAGATRRSVFRTLLQPRKSHGAHDDIMARSLALSDGECYLVICAVDIVGLFYSQIAAIKKAVYQSIELRPLDIIVCATHTHGGPDTCGLHGGTPDRYLHLVIRNTATSIVEALKRLQPAALGFAATQIESLTQHIHNPHAPIDREASILLVRDTDVKQTTIATLVNFPCHPDIVGTRNHMITGDFPGYLTRRLEEYLGGMAMYINGAQGDIYPMEAILDPQQKKGLRTFAQAEAFGFRLAQSILKAMDGAHSQPQGTMQILKKEFYIPISNRWIYLLKSLGLFKRELYDDKIKTEMYAVKINNAEILTLPGQAVSKAGRFLKARMKSEFKFLFGLANDEIAYIVPPEDFDKKLGREVESHTLGIMTWDVIKQNAPKF
jgi:hypothetical protein